MTFLVSFSALRLFSPLVAQFATIGVYVYCCACRPSFISVSAVGMKLVVFSTRLSLPPYPPPPSPSALSGCDAWKCGMKQNDAPNVRFLTHLQAIWILSCKLAKGAILL